MRDASSAAVDDAWRREPAATANPELAALPVPTAPAGKRRRKQSRRHGNVGDITMKRVANILVVNGA